MALILNEKYIGKNSYSLFITNRFLRLMPLYWTVLLLTVLIEGVAALVYSYDNGIVFLYRQYHEQLSFTSLIVLVVSNVVVFGQDIIMFLKLDTTGQLGFTSNFRDSEPQLWTFLSVPQAWSLAVEMMFYLIAPFIVRLRFRYMISIIFISIALRGSFYYFTGWHSDPWNYRFFPFELAFFLFGAVGYKFYRRLKKFEGSKQLGSIQNIVFISIVAFTMLYQFIPGNHLKQAIFYAFVIVSVPLLFNRSKNNKFENMIGELSYPIYISHWLVIYCINWFGLHREATYYGELTSAIAIILSFIMMRYIIAPIEVIRRNRSKQNRRIESNTELNTIDSYPASVINK
jgi:peptidoglycan/LPS O-acetylase OafA/YrhL